MTVNTGGSRLQSTTPPRRGRTVREMFLDYLRKLRKHYDEALAVEAEYQTLVGVRYESSTLAAIASSDDPRWRQAVADEQFAERLANTYGQAAVLSAIEELLAEVRNTNLLLCAQMSNTNDPFLVQEATKYQRGLENRVERN